MARYALISDIHGNFKALEAFLEYIQGNPVDGIISLGDYVTDGPYPEKIMELLYGMRERYVCHMIRGNREDYLLDNVNNKEGWKPSSANGTLYYTLLSLSKRDMEFFASLPTEREVVIEGCPPLYICHGTPGRVRGNVQWEEGLKEKILRELPRPYDYLLGGHSHHQEIERHGGKTYINPGSLGFAMDGVGKHGQFAVLTGDGEGWRTEFLSIPYDVSAYLEAFAVSGVDEIGMTLNKAVKKSLVTGVNYFFRCIQAMEEEAKNVGAGSMAELPEAAWELLAERFGL
ncbi:metallophosphoesterase [bacterium D16-50]|nr:metallophosphoesterase [bacterium D16-50]